MSFDSIVIGTLLVVCFGLVLTLGLFTRGAYHRLQSQDAVGRVRLAEIERWRATSVRLAEMGPGSFPRVQLPWSYVDSEGNGIRIAPGRDDPDAVDVSIAWREAGRQVLITTVSLDTWEQRTEAASAILTAMADQAVTR